MYLKSNLWVFFCKLSAFIDADASFIFFFLILLQEPHHPLGIPSTTLIFHILLPSFGLSKQSEWEKSKQGINSLSYGLKVHGMCDV